MTDRLPGAGAEVAVRLAAVEPVLAQKLLHFKAFCSRQDAFLARPGLHQRLAPAHFNRATVLAEPYSPEDAIAAGFLDRVVPAADLADAARETATRLAKLNMAAHTATKLTVSCGATP